MKYLTGYQDSWRFFRYRSQMWRTWILKYFVKTIRLRGIWVGKVIPKTIFPVSLGCRIYQLHLCRRLRPPPHNVGCEKCLRIESRWLSSQWPGNWNGHMICNTLFRSLLRWLGGQKDSIRSIKYSYQAFVPTRLCWLYFSNCFFSKQYPTWLYLQSAWRWLRINYIEITIL